MTRPIPGILGKLGNARIPICGSIYSKAILAGSMAFAFAILNHQIDFVGGLIPCLILLMLGVVLFSFELSAIKKNAEYPRQMSFIEFSQKSVEN